MKLEVLREADYVLNVCGRPVPPPGFKFVDLPRIIPYSLVLTSAPGTPFQQRVANNSATLFICRGVVIRTQVGLRIKWPNGRFLNQFPQVDGLAVDVFPLANGGAMIALDKPVLIDKDAKITIEMSGFSAGSVTLQFWGCLRYMLREVDSIGGSGGLDTACLVGYPSVATQLSGEGMMPDPIADLEARARYWCGTAQNLFAPEFLLGDQCTPEIPEGFDDETFTFFSDPIVVPVDSQNYGNAVIIPGQEDVVIRNMRPISTYGDGVGGGTIPTFALRLPNGYSITGGDQIPTAPLFRFPSFPTLRLHAGDRLIIDMADLSGTGVGAITTTWEFDGVKRRKKRAA